MMRSTIGRISVRTARSTCDHLPTIPKLWVKYQNFSPIQLSTKGCQNIYDFIKACKKEHQIEIPLQQLFLSITVGGPDLRPDLNLSQISSQNGYIENSAAHPLIFGTIEAASNIFYLLKGKLFYLQSCDHFDAGAEEHRTSHGAFHRKEMKQGTKPAP